MANVWSTVAWNRERRSWNKPTAPIGLSVRSMGPQRGDFGQLRCVRSRVDHGDDSGRAGPCESRQPDRCRQLCLVSRPGDGGSRDGVLEARRDDWLDRDRCRRVDSCRDHRRGRLRPIGSTRRRRCGHELRWYGLPGIRQSRDAARRQPLARTLDQARAGYSSDAALETLLHEFRAGARSRWSNSTSIRQRHQLAEHRVRAAAVQASTWHVVVVRDATPARSAFT